MFGITKTGLRAVLFVLLVPLLASALASDARSRWGERWSRGLQREFRIHGYRAGDSMMGRYSLSALCSDARTAAKTPPCRTYNRLSSMTIAGGGTAAFGLLLLGAVAAAGVLSRRREQTLFRGLRPVVNATAAGLVLLLVAHGLLAVGVVSLSGMLFGASASSLAFTLAGAALLVIGIGASQAARVSREVADGPWLFGRLLDAGPGSRLGEALARVARRVGAQGVPQVVAGLAPVVFVSPPGAHTLDGRHAEPTLHFSLALGRILSLAELEALMTAQLFRMRDEGGVRAAGFWNSWSRLQQERDRLADTRGLRWVMSLPVVWFVSFLVDAFRPAATRAWKKEEAAGDQAEAFLAGSREYGVALLKTAAFAPAWGSTLEAMALAVAEGEQYVNAGELFAETVASNATPERVLAALNGGGGASGRSLARRLEQLGLDPASLVTPALHVRPEAPAIALLDHAAAIEEELSTGRHLQLLRARR